VTIKSKDLELSFSSLYGDNYNKYIKCKLTERISTPAESRLGTTVARSCVIKQAYFKFSIRYNLRN
jgi:hypothetical protein